MSDIDWAKAIKRVRNGYLQELKFAEERPYDRNDFIAHLDTSYECLRDTLDVIKAQLDLKTSLLKENRDVFKNFTVSSLLLCGENVQSKEWNESRHIEIRYDISVRAKFFFHLDRRLLDISEMQLIKLNVFFAAIKYFDI